MTLKSFNLKDRKLFQQTTLRFYLSSRLQRNIKSICKTRDVNIYIFPTTAKNTREMVTMTRKQENLFKVSEMLSQQDIRLYQH